MKDTGSKILLTSRNRDVALHANPIGFFHELQFLNDEKSRDLLEKIAISWRQGTNNIYLILLYSINFSFLVFN